MKKLTKLFPAALAVIALASCTSDDLDLGSSTSIKLKDGQILGVVEDLNFGDLTTRNGMGEFGGSFGDGVASRTGGAGFIWSTGDQFKMYAAKSWKTDIYTVASTAHGNTQAAFDPESSTTNIEEGDVAFGIYPYAKGNLPVYVDDERTTLTVTLPGYFQYYKEEGTAHKDSRTEESAYGDFFGAILPMWGFYNSDNQRINFRYLTGLVRIEVEGYLPAGAVGMVCESPFEQVSGSYWADIEEIANSYYDGTADNSEAPNLKQVGTIDNTAFDTWLQQQVSNSDLYTQTAGASTEWLRRNYSNNKIFMSFYKDPGTWNQPVSGYETMDHVLYFPLAPGTYRFTKFYFVRPFVESEDNALELGDNVIYNQRTPVYVKIPVKVRYGSAANGTVVDNVTNVIEFGANQTMSYVVDKGWVYPRTDNTTNSSYVNVHVFGSATTDITATRLHEVNDLLRDVKVDRQTVINVHGNIRSTDGTSETDALAGDTLLLIPETWGAPVTINFVDGLEAAGANNDFITSRKLSVINRSDFDVTVNNNGSTQDEITIWAEGYYRYDYAGEPDTDDAHTVINGSAEYYKKGDGNVKVGEGFNIVNICTGSATILDNGNTPRSVVNIYSGEPITIDGDSITTLNAFTSAVSLINDAGIQNINTTSGTVSLVDWCNATNIKTETGDVTVVTTATANGKGGGVKKITSVSGNITIGSATAASRTGVDNNGSEGPGAGSAELETSGAVNIYSALDKTYLPYQVTLTSADATLNVHGGYVTDIKRKGNGVAAVTTEGNAYIKQATDIAGIDITAYCTLAENGSIAVTPVDPQETDAATVDIYTASQLLGYNTNATRANTLQAKFEMNNKEIENGLGTVEKTFDGNGKYINQLKIKAGANAAGGGLFTTTGGDDNEAEIKNLTLKNIAVSAEANVANGMGILIGQVAGKLPITSVKLEGTNTIGSTAADAQNIGGLIGKIVTADEVTIKDVAIAVNEIKGYNRLGGVIGSIVGDGNDGADVTITTTANSEAATPKIAITKFTSTKTVSGIDREAGRMGVLVGSIESEDAKFTLVTPANAHPVSRDVNPNHEGNVRYALDNAGDGSGYTWYVASNPFTQNRITLGLYANKYVTEDKIYYYKGGLDQAIGFSGKNDGSKITSTIGDNMVTICGLALYNTDDNGEDPAGSDVTKANVAEFVNVFVELTGNGLSDFDEDAYNAFHQYR